ncbi:MAG TPA: methionine adenosyltransferase, partial [Cyanophyceae cyanobacterium]
MKKDFMFTSESVTEGHPDKLCDQISDAIVDHFLRRDPFSRVITECAVSTSIVFISARFESDAIVDFTKIARQVIKQVGYEQPDFNAKTCTIMTSLKELSSGDYRHWDEKKLSEEEIEQIPVNDQVTVFGFACNQTPVMMPLPIWLAHQLARRLADVRIQNILPYLAPDGKTQVGVEYKDHRPHRLHSITLIASQNQPLIEKAPDLKQLQKDLKETVIDFVFQNEEIKPDEKTRILIDSDDPFAIGGPSAHSGLTGRKNAIDTYGEYSRHSGAALSGKDPTRIDRVGAYAARYAAKNVVAAGLADECEVQLSYSIGLSRPVSIQVETFGTGKISDEEITALLEEHFDFRLAGIIRQFNLRLLPSIFKNGFYRKLAAYG